MSRTYIPEREIQKTILDWLKYKHIFHMRFNSGASILTHKGKTRLVRFGKKGAPDILVIIKGQIYGIEVKAESQNQSWEQIEFQAEFERAGGKYVVAWRLSDVEAILNGHSGV